MVWLRLAKNSGRTELCHLLLHTSARQRKLVEKFQESVPCFGSSSHSPAAYLTPPSRSTQSRRLSSMAGASTKTTLLLGQEILEGKETETPTRNSPATEAKFIIR